MSNSYIINGVKIAFPITAYSSQISIMNKVTQALRSSKNCLIESPTGTGKTLALLCSSLAYINQQRSGSFISDETNSNEFLANTYPLQIPTNTNDHCPGSSSKTVIYYCTRTHYQINQVISELKRTQYCDKELKMSILSSRAHSCVNTNINQFKNVASICKSITSGKTPEKERCKFFSCKDKDKCGAHLSNMGLKGVWNLGEIIDAGKKGGICPYFSAKELAIDADIIFAPYNYLINPMIAEKMSIDVNNKILIFDEAHNLEDACRSVMSMSVTNEQFIFISNEIRRFASKIPQWNHKDIIHALMELSEFCASFANWLKSFEDDINEDYRKSIILTGENFKKLFETDLKVDINFLRNIMKDYYDISYRENLSKISDFINQILSSLFTILENLLGSSQDLYTISIKKGFIAQKANSGGHPLHKEEMSQDAKHKRQNYDQVKQNQLSINFICLSPSLAFKQIKAARSIILASGTLSPLNSFAPELGCPFDITLQVSDHLQKEQCQVYALGVDRWANPLKLTYDTRDSPTLKDEVGAIITQLCLTVPNGVLCFFASYSMMERYIDYWKMTSVYEKIGKIKKIFVDRKEMSAIDAKQLLNNYFESIRLNSLNGSIFFAVCRGRISEGVDFSDEKARAVIAVGIPYPNMGSPEIEQKMLFNDNIWKESEHNKNILSGGEWYKIQAYRALNQAMGRCIRHTKDWGAIIMIDERFNYKSNQSYLSPWIKDRLCTFENFEKLNMNLKSFVSLKSNKRILEINKIVPLRSIEADKPIIKDYHDLHIPPQIFLNEKSISCRDI